MAHQTKLVSLLARAGHTQATACHILRASKTTISRICVHGAWPQKDGDRLKQELAALLEAGGVTADEIRAAFEAPGAPGKQTSTRKDGTYMKRKQTLTPKARQHFKAVSDIFNRGMSEPEDVHLSQDLRYAREVMRETVRSGGMLALYGESGSGKTTIVQEMLDNYRRAGSNTIVIAPYVVGMTINRKSPLALNMAHICEAVIKALGGDYKISTSPESRFEYMHKLLVESSDSGFKHVLLFEEAHNMPSETIKQLKRINELTNGGFTRILAVILVGQNELARLLSEHNASLREVVQRMELLELRPLRDVESYVTHRCARAGVKFEDVFDATAMPALAQVLTLIPEKGQRSGKSMLYPLFVGNVLTEAMNLAAEMGAPKVNGDVVVQAHRQG